jgi:hypothetical protein
MQGESAIPEHPRSYTFSEGYFLDPWDNPYAIVMDTSFDGQIGGPNGLNGDPVLDKAIGDYIVYISPTKDGTFPGVKAGVMSWGPSPGDTNSLIMSWR